MTKARGTTEMERISGDEIGADLEAGLVKAQSEFSRLENEGWKDDDPRFYRDLFVCWTDPLKGMPKMPEHVREARIAQDLCVLFVAHVSPPVTTEDVRFALRHSEPGLSRLSIDSGLLGALNDSLITWAERPGSYLTLTVSTNGSQNQAKTGR